LRFWRSAVSFFGSRGNLETLPSGRACALCVSAVGRSSFQRFARRFGLKRVRAPLRRGLSALSKGDDDLAGVYIQHALPLVQQQLLNAGIRSTKSIGENFAERLEHFGRMKAQPL
jgi:hypothetical protein